MAFRSLKQYYGQNVIQNIIPASDYPSNTEVVFEDAERSITMTIPVTCWALIEFFNEAEKKNGTVITAVFVDNLKHEGELNLTTLTTLQEFLQRHGNYKFLGFGGESAKTVIREIHPEPTSDSSKEG